MWKGINYQLIFTGVNLIFICRKVHNYHSRCPPITIKNGIYNISENKYICNKGNYYLFGNETLECQEDGSWKGEMPYCATAIPTVIWKVFNDTKEIFLNGQCVEAKNNESWEIKVFGKPFTDPILFEYKLPYNTKENIRFTIRENLWHDFKICGIYVYSKKPETCMFSSLTLPNGYITSTDILLNYGEYISFNCNEGFQLHGYRYIYCGVTNAITLLSHCQRIECKDSPNKVLNGIWENWNRSKNYSYEDELHLNCKFGYELNATGSIKCLKNGEWSHTTSICLSI
ncbi:sushi, von Willebrand factor type A, EGF and pentraxin domain-containing protein 1-like [Centruroides sculpturatus]|uniref:sushi, von Willebrand factor type A, EGF and pentraxin domain-containing protein 1-like n=1 Tax=Centruroides sculpturatus TaxID=218467 RepID=UPI000C6E04E4|nr:sushi, von Willebrand factor type A, EGF and pentraxin domain-containing protein 1-like [Centruroides sculpturatus]